jgi:hypothetical protein
LRASLFDYCLLGVGLAHRDCRNLPSWLGQQAVEAFYAEYGPLDPRHAILDGPLANLHGLWAEARRQRFPG